MSPKPPLAAKFAGIEMETVAVDSTNGDPVLDAANPLSKIPCLVLDDGTGIYDSRSITRYLDRASGGKLFPTDSAGLLKAERIEALCDGINDCAVGFMYEMRFRPEEKVHKPWQERLWGKVERGSQCGHGRSSPVRSRCQYRFNCAEAPVLDISICALPANWESGRDDLVAWRDAFDASHPELADLKPTA